MSTCYTTDSYCRSVVLLVLLSLLAGVLGCQDDDDMASPTEPECVALGPEGLEVCNGLDDDCDGLVDEGVLETFFPDADGDGEGTDASDVLSPLEACDAPTGYVSTSTDCDDQDRNINSFAPELCNGEDDDCDGLADEDVEMFTLFPDQDGDGFGFLPAGESPSVDCTIEDGVALQGGDCDDTDALVSPSSLETCNEKDDDCDELVDESLEVITSYPDSDRDGYGDEGRSTESCEVLPGNVLVGGDCDDLDPDIAPDKLEVPYDGMDQDCSGADLSDVDGDGVDGLEAGGMDCVDTDATIYPGAEELCDSLDHDCDGVPDSGCEATVPPSPGDLLITEIMPNPARVDDSVGEWFEVFNASNSPLELGGLKIRDNGSEITLPSPMRLSPRAYAVFGKEADFSLNGGVKMTYAYGSTIGLSNGSDWLEVLTASDVSLDKVKWDDAATFPENEGIAMNLDLEDYDITLNDVGASWCGSVTLMPSGDKGTPGAQNVACALTLVDEDGDGACAAVDCDDHDPTRYPGALELCDEIDNDCDKETDEKPACDPADVDRDGAPETTDCDESNSTIYPGALDIPLDGIDQDCDGIDATSCGGRLRIRVAAANLTTGDDRSYDPGEGIRILQGLHPDVAVIQEMNYGDNSEEAFRAFVDLTFGPDFSICRGPAASIPNAVISRYPLLNCGYFEDTLTQDREHEWAQIDLPGASDLYAISLHLLTSSADTRNQEARTLVNYAKESIPSSDYLIIGGDFNTSTNDEPALTTMAQVVSFAHIPVDANNNPNTNLSRSKPYDWVLPDSDLDRFHVPLEIGESAYPQGLVFDSRVYIPLTEVYPITFGDSSAPGMQHMAVVKEYHVPVCE